MCLRQIKTRQRQLKWLELIRTNKESTEKKKAGRPGEWLEYSPILTILIAVAHDSLHR